MSEPQLRNIDKRGTISLPSAMRRGIKRVEIVKRPDGVIELRPVLLIDQNQAWFWSERWQAMEREADEDISTGRVKKFDRGEDFLTALDAGAEAEI